MKTQRRDNLITCGRQKRLYLRQLRVRHLHLRTVGWGNTPTCLSQRHSSVKVAQQGGRKAAACQQHLCKRVCECKAIPQHQPTGEAPGLAGVPAQNKHSPCPPETGSSRAPHVQEGFAVERVRDHHLLFRLHPVSKHCKEAGRLGTQGQLSAQRHRAGGTGRQRRRRRSPRLLTCAGLVPDISLGLNFAQLATPRARAGSRRAPASRRRPTRAACCSMAAACGWRGVGYVI